MLDSLYTGVAVIACVPNREGRSDPSAALVPGGRADVMTFDSLETPMRIIVSGLGVLLLLGACQGPSRPPTRSLPPAPPPDVVAEAPVVPAVDAGVPVDLPRATHPPVPSLRVGINGTRNEPQALACRGYTLSYARRESHLLNDPDHEYLSDLWWALGGENNRVDVSAARPVEFHEATVRWHQAPSGPSAQCHPVVDLEVGGRVVATFEPESECAQPGTAGDCVQQTTHTWSEATRAESVRLIDRSRGSGGASEGACGIVQRLDLGEIPDAARPMLVARVGEVLHHSHSEGVGPGGYHFRVGGRGLFAVAPTGQPIHLSGAGVRAMEAANEVVVIGLPGTSHSYLAAPASMGTTGNLARELYLADAARPTRGMTRVHAFDSPLDDLWYDHCASVLRVTTEDHRRWRVTPTGSVQEDAPPAASPPSVEPGALAAMDRDCSAQSPCPQGLVCAPYVIPDLGTRSRCALPCQSDSDCLTLSAEADRACVTSFFAHGECECRPGVAFRRCAQGAGGHARTCSDASTFQHYEGRGVCP